MILVVAGMFQVLDSCLQAGADPLNFIAWGVLESIKYFVGQAIN